REDRRGAEARRRVNPLALRSGGSAPRKSALQPRAQAPGGTLCHLPIPKRGPAALGPLTRECVLRCGGQGRSLQKAIGSFGDGDRALGVLAQRRARDAEVSGLLLHTAGIRDGDRASGYQVHELNVAQGIGNPDCPITRNPVEEAKFLETLARARVYGE